MHPNTRPGRLALALCLALSAPMASAGEIATIAGTLKLPYDFSIENESFHQTKSSRMASTKQRFDLVGTSGALKGQKFGAYVAYVAITGVSAGQLETWERENSEKTAKEAGTREVRPMSVDGFSFYLIDELTGDDAPEGDDAKGAVEDEKKDSGKPEEVRRAVHMIGAVNGAQVEVGVWLPKDADTKSAVEFLRAFVPDHKQLLLASGNFADEQKLRAVGTTMKTAVGNLMAPSGATATLVSSGILRDGGGRVLSRNMTFNLTKMNFWTGWQGLNVFTSCSRPEAWTPEQIAESDAWPEGIKNVTGTGSKEPLQLGGISGTSRDATRNEKGTRYDLTHWSGADAAHRYELQVTRFNGKRSEDQLLKQLAGSTFRCDEDPAYGARAAAAPSAAAPAAATAPAASPQPAAGAK